MRASSRLNPEASEYVIVASGPLVMGRKAQWILNFDDQAEFRIPCSREDFDRIPKTSEYIAFFPYYRYGESWIRLVFLDRDLEEVFLRFCESVMAELVKGTSPADSLQVIMDRYRRLFEQNHETVTLEKMRGLFAELVFLDKLLDAGVDAVRGWLGPTGETHDFVFGGNHFEVKSLRASGERSVQVSNIHQLDCPSGKELYLVGVRLFPGNETIGSMIEKIREKLTSKQCRQLEFLLSKVNCTFPVNDDWNAKRFSFDEPVAWFVDKSFPRIVCGMLPGGIVPVGVSGVKYTVSLEYAEANKKIISTVISGIINGE